ncbi:hypothetical protein MRX96_001750 [Rhipicephalus microplus]
MQLILKNGEPVKTYNEFTSHTHALEYMRHDDWKSALPIRLFFTHLPVREDKMNKEVKYIYLARNPWDVCVSFYNMVTDVSIWNFQDGTFEEFVDAFLETDLGQAIIGGWKEYFTPELLTHMEKKIREQGDNAAFMELWKDIREEALAMSDISQ